jgi:hypothetical protein
MAAPGVGRRVTEYEQSLIYSAAASHTEAYRAEPLAILYLVMLPLVLGAALAEGHVAVADARRALRLEILGLTSLADLAGRRLLAFLPYTLAAPVARLGVRASPVHAQSLDSVWSVRCCSSSVSSSSITGSIAPATRCAGSGHSHSVHHSPNQFNFAMAYRLGWIGRFTGTSIFFTPLVLLGFDAGDGADGPVPQPALPVLDPCRLDPEAGLA